MASYSAALLCITEAENQVFAALGPLSTTLFKQKPPPSVIIQALNTIPWCWQTAPTHLLDSSTSLSKCMDQHRPQHRWKLKSFLWYPYLYPDLALPSVINSYFMSHCSAGPVHCPQGLCFISFQVGLLARAESCSVVLMRVSEANIICPDRGALDSSNHVPHLILRSDVCKVVGLPVHATFVSVPIWKLRPCFNNRFYCHWQSPQSSGADAGSSGDRDMLVLWCCCRGPQCFCRGLSLSIKLWRMQTARPHL